MKPSAVRAAGSRTMPAGTHAPAGRGRKAGRRVALLAALAGGPFLTAYGLTRLHSESAPPGTVWIPGGLLQLPARRPPGPHAGRRPVPRRLPPREDKGKVGRGPGGA